jgi:hypothetical protein
MNKEFFSSSLKGRGLNKCLKRGILVKNYHFYKF